MTQMNITETKLTHLNHSQLVEQFDTANKKHSSLLLVAVIVFFAITAMVIRSMMGFYEESTRQNAVDTLQGILKSTHHTIQNVWMNARFEEVNRWASQPELKQSVQELLDFPKTSPEDLRTHPAQAKIREFFKTRAQTYDFRGIFVINAEGISLASMRDNNLGTTNMIVSSFEDRFDSALKGKNVFVPPMKSDVPLPDVTGELVEEYPTMFIMVPIFDQQEDTVLAVLTVRLDPFAELFPILEQNQLGNSKQTYLIDQEGSFLSRVRFEDDLIQMGLLESGSDAILTMQARIPEQRPAPQSLKPDKNSRLTHAASTIALGQSGNLMEGATGYRGKRVLSTWIWDPERGIGLIAEEDEEDALSAYRQAEKIIIILSVIILSLAVWIALMYIAAQRLYVGEQNQRKLFNTAIKKSQPNEANLNAVFDSVNEGIITMDTNGTILTCNPAFCRILGYRTSELIGQNIQSMVL